MKESSQHDTDVEYYGEKPIRWYQKAVRAAVAQNLSEGIKRVLIVLPTGAGKTIAVAASLSDSTIQSTLNVPYDRPLRVLFASHKTRLLTQADNTFLEESNVEVIQQSIFSDIPNEVISQGWDVTVLDEAHHESCATFQYMLDNLGDIPIIGLTATPDRPDGCLIKFEVIINPISREQAVEEGWLAPTFLNTIVDTSARNKVEITKLIIDEYGHEFGQTLMFFSTKKEVRDVADYLNDLGYKAVPILNQTEKLLDDVLEEFSRGEHQFVLNCNKISEGVDVKNCTSVYLGRQFGSYPQLNQVIGRAARPDSDCNVWELINPMSSTNLDTTVVVGTPEKHRLISRRKGQWREQEFDYTHIETNPLKSYV